MSLHSSNNIMRLLLMPPQHKTHYKVLKYDYNLNYDFYQYNLRFFRIVPLDLFILRIIWLGFTNIATSLINCCTCHSNKMYCLYVWILLYWDHILSVYNSYKFWYMISVWSIYMYLILLYTIYSLLSLSDIGNTIFL